MRQVIARAVTALLVLWVILDDLPAGAFGELQTPPGAQGPAGPAGPAGTVTQSTATCYVSSQGSDLNPGTIALPVLTIAQAIAVCAPTPTCAGCGGVTDVRTSSIIWVERGLYAENVTIPTREDFTLHLDNYANAPYGITTISLDSTKLFGDSSVSVPQYQFSAMSGGEVHSYHAGHMAQMGVQDTALIIANNATHPISDVRIAYNDIRLAGVTRATGPDMAYRFQCKDAAFTVGQVNGNPDAGNALTSPVIDLASANVASTIVSQDCSYRGAVTAAAIATSHNDHYVGNIKVTATGYVNPTDDQTFQIYGPGFTDVVFETKTGGGGFTFNGPAGTFRADGVSNGTFEASGWTLTGLATKVPLESWKGMNFTTADNISTTGYLEGGAIDVGTTQTTSPMSIVKNQNAQTNALVSNTTSGTASAACFGEGTGTSTAYVCDIDAANTAYGTLAQNKAALIGDTNAAGVLLLAQKSGATVDMCAGAATCTNPIARVAAAGFQCGTSQQLQCDLSGNVVTTGYVEAGSLNVGTTQTTFSMEVLKSQNAITYGVFSNVTSGTASETAILMNGGTQATYFENIDPANTAYGTGAQQRGLIRADTNSKGLLLMAQKSTGTIDFFAGSATETTPQAQITSAGNLTVGSAFTVTNSTGYVASTIPIIMHNISSLAGTLLATNTIYDNYTLPAHAATLTAITGYILTAGSGGGSLHVQFADGTNTCDCAVTCTTVGNFRQASCTTVAGAGCVFPASAAINMQTKNATDCTVYPTLKTLHSEINWQ